MRFFIRQIFKNFYFYLFCIIAFSIPLPTIFSNVAIGVLVLYWLSEGKFYEKFKRLKDRHIFQLFLLLYIIHIAGLLHTENLDVGLFSLQKKIPLLIFPLIIGSLPRKLLSRSKAYIVILFFTISCAFVSLSNILFDHLLVVHATYLGIYLLFGTSFLIISSYGPKNRYYVLFFVFLAVLANVLNSSRMTLIVLLLLINILFTIQFLKSKRYLPLILLIFLNLTSIIGTLIYTPSRDKFSKLIEFRGDFIRQRNWKSNMEVITCNLIFGVGIGDATAELQKARDTLWHEYVFAYNSHNQYLQTALELGMIGLLVLLICIAIPSVISLQRNNFLYLIFIISFFLPSVIESTFGLQKGTLYYGFFNSFLFLYGSKVKFTKWGAKNKNFSVSS